MPDRALLVPVAGRHIRFLATCQAYHRAVLSGRNWTVRNAIVVVTVIWIEPAARDRNDGSFPCDLGFETEMACPECGHFRSASARAIAVAVVT